MKNRLLTVLHYLARFRKHFTAFLGLVMLVVLIKLFNYATGDPVSDKAYQNYFNSSYKIFGITIPKAPEFCGEPVPLSDYTIRESLEKELLINTYWQSQTLLFFKRCNRWFPVIEPILKRNSIPDDFKYVAVIESGLTNVVSPAGATGFWQLVDPTARNYGLEISEEIDERYSVEKSTEAACRFFHEAYAKYHNWTLVAAAYNLGMGGIDKQLEKQKTNNYYDLFLNDETARYVFRILAVKNILIQPKTYGFELRKKDLYPPLPTYVVKIDSSVTDLTDFALKQGTTYKILKILNPWLRKNSLNNTLKKTYSLQFLKNGAKLYAEDETEPAVPGTSDTSHYVTPAEITIDSLRKK
ncbi:MAG TPA: lytic transglycosylase domain-containing protein [Bacteroidia bacterium]|jgi:membrane-bound lytic murein transglycosylase D|nr:lytic transglycosylase domain-containing protein [Bacteroidia bacterium]